MNRRAFILATAATLAAGCLRSGPGGRVRVAAGEPGGLYFAFAEVLANQIRSRLPDVTVEIRATEGSVQNLALLRSGEADLGLALADVCERDRATGPPTTAPLAVARVNEDYIQVIVPNSAAVQRLFDLQGKKISIGPTGSGVSAFSHALFEAAQLSRSVDMLSYRLKDALPRLADRSIDALVWAGGVPTPAIADLDVELPLRIIDIGPLAAQITRLSGFPYVLRQVPTCAYVPPGVHSIGVPNLLLCRNGIADDLVRGVVNTLATDAAYLVPPYIRGLQYLDTPSMIQTGLIPLHPAATATYRELHD